MLSCYNSARKALMATFTPPKLTSEDWAKLDAEASGQIHPYRYVLAWVGSITAVTLCFVLAPDDTPVGIAAVFLGVAFVAPVAIYGAMKYRQQWHNRGLPLRRVGPKVSCNDCGMIHSRRWADLMETCNGTDGTFTSPPRTLSKEETRAIRTAEAHWSGERSKGAWVAVAVGLTICAFILALTPSIARSYDSYGFRLGLILMICTILGVIFAAVLGETVEETRAERRKGTCGNCDAEVSAEQVSTVSARGRSDS